MDLLYGHARTCGAYQLVSTCVTLLCLLRRTGLLLIRIDPTALTPIAVWRMTLRLPGQTHRPYGLRGWPFFVTHCWVSEHWNVKTHAWPLLPSHSPFVHVHVHVCIYY